MNQGSNGRWSLKHLALERIKDLLHKKIVLIKRHAVKESYWDVE